MFKMKKIALMVFVLGNSALFAGTMGPVCASGNVTVPCQQKGWDFGGKALYLQSSWGALNFPIFQTVNGVEEFRNASTPWDWGFMFEGSYHFATSADVNLNWYHLNDTHHINVDGHFTSATNTAFSGIGPDRTTTKPTWDAVNLEFGQHVDYTSALSLRYHGGFEFVRVDFKRSSDIYAPAPDISSALRTISYNGFGPRTGIDASYNFGRGLSVNANTGVGLYAGSSKFSSRTTVTGGVYRSPSKVTGLKLFT